MSDQMCSGSGNAIKTFNGYTSQDRSLQQDRAGPAAGPQVHQFRSAGSDQAGIQDAVFQQHLAGPAPIDDSMQIHHTVNTGPAMHHPVSAPLNMMRAAQQTPMPTTTQLDWAMQFQQMNTPTPATASSMPSVVQQAPQPMQMMPYAPQLHRSGVFEHLSGGPVIYKPINDSGFKEEMNHWMATHGPSPQEQDFEREMAQWMHANGPTAEAEITANMERIALEAEHEDALKANGLSTDAAINREMDAIAQELDIRDSDEAEKHATQISDEEVIQESEKRTELDEAQAHNNDELAAAAQRIVDVMDAAKASKKIQESYFLQLMRQLADREVLVRNEEFVTRDGDKVEPMSARNGSEQNIESGSVASHSAPMEWAPIDLTAKHAD